MNQHELLSKIRQSYLNGCVFLRCDAKPAWLWINPATGRLTVSPMPRREAQEFAKNQGQKAVFRKDLS